MTLRDTLVDLFGEENISTWPMADLRKIGLAPGSAQVLSDVGLPRHTHPVFTTQVEGEPALFSEFEFPLGGTPTKILILGGPPGDPATRYFLDVFDSVVGLFTFSEDAPRGEVVNTSVHDFAAFLALTEKYVRSLPGTKPIERLKLIRELEVRLREQDSFAFDKDDGWWTAVLDHLRGDLRV